MMSNDRERLVEEYAHLVKYIAYRLAVRLPSNVNVNNLIGAGMIGLLEAIDNFDPERGVKLETFAYLRVKGAMLDELRAMDWVAPSVRQKSRQLQDTYTTLEARLGRPPTEEETAHELGISLQDYQTLLYKVQGLAVITLEDFGISKGEKEEDYLGCLQDTSKGGTEVNTGFEEIKKILAQFIDILPEKEKIVLSLYYYDELTLKEIGDLIGLTESRICQLHSQAILRLKEKLRNPKSHNMKKERKLIKEKCCNHPENDSVGECRYCGRRICKDCMKIGRNYLCCKNDDNCLDYQSKENDIDSSVPIDNYNDEKERELMKSLCLSFVGDIGRSLENEGFNKPIKVLEIVIFGMTVVTQTYILGKRLDNASSKLKQFQLDMAHYVTNKYFLKETTTEDTNDVLEYQRQFYAIVADRYAEYKLLFAEDIDNPGTVFSKSLGAFLNNLFVEPISEDDKPHVIVPMAIQLAEFYAVCLQSFE